MPGHRRVIITLVLSVSALVLTGCAQAEAPASSTGSAWSDRMAQLFGDPAGLGGGGGAVTAAGRTGSGSTKVILGSARGGSYDVLGVCTGSGIMRLTVVETDPTKTGSGRDTVLAVSDIACGATLRLPVTVSKSEVSLAVSQNTGAAQWWASIVSPGWEPSPTSYSR